MLTQRGWSYVVPFRSDAVRAAAEAVVKAARHPAKTRTECRRPIAQVPVCSIWTLKVCKIIAFQLVFGGLGLFFTYFRGSGMVYAARGAVAECLT